MPAKFIVSMRKWGGKKSRKFSTRNLIGERQTSLNRVLSFFQSYYIFFRIAIDRALRWNWWCFPISCRILSAYPSAQSPFSAVCRQWGWECKSFILHLYAEPERVHKMVFIFFLPSSHINVIAAGRRERKVENVVWYLNASESTVCSSRKFLEFPEIPYTPKWSCLFCCLLSARFYFILWLFAVIHVRRGVLVCTWNIQRYRSSGSKQKDK